MSILGKALVNTLLAQAERSYFEALKETASLADGERDADGYTKRERQEAIVAMQLAANVFYALAMGAGVHSFHEFSGLMSEYITACIAAEDEGKPWLHANACVGAIPAFLPPAFHQYLDTKLRCMFGVGLELQPPTRTPTRRRRAK